MNSNDNEKSNSYAIQKQGFGTRAIHAGQEPDPTTGAVIPPISLATTFAQSSADTFEVISFFYHYRTPCFLMKLNKKKGNT